VIVIVVSFMNTGDTGNDVLLAGVSASTGAVSHRLKEIREVKK
jgi:hypothetical protein